MMFGYACDETDALMPLPIHLAHRMAQRHAEVRRAGTIPYLRPDGKTQVTFDYEDDHPVRLRTVLVSTQHNDGIDRDTMIRPDLVEHVIRARRRAGRSAAGAGPPEPSSSENRHEQQGEDAESQSGHLRNPENIRT
jgi:S-adenosylmethionine synthetase